ncbi:MAG: cytochrome c-type biogenesis protein CcmH [Nitrospira sp.]|nr:cytochrome c-type biogenesis protein CcmH [Nitrospira sp.]
MNWVIVLLLVSGSAWAGEARPMGDNPAIEARLKQLASELRCLVCQNQTLADSNAPQAEDLRREVREMIAQNMSDQEIIDFLVSRYGDFVLYRPPFKPTTVLLWAGPFVLMVGGGVALAVTLRRRQHMIREAMMTEDDRRRVEQLLSQRSKES